MSQPHKTSDASTAGKGLVCGLARASGWAFVEVALLYRDATQKAKRGTTIEDINAEVMAQLIARHAD